MIDDFNKRQRVIDLGEEAEDEILQSTGKTESTFDTPQYRRVMKACKERDKFPTQAWIPDEEECVHTKLHKAEVNEELSKAECFNAIVEGMKILGWDKKEDIDFTQDSEYQRMFEGHTDAMKQQSELIERWVEQEEKRLPPSPPMSPFS